MPRPEQLDYALFDFDGVLADTEPLYLEADRKALQALGYNPTQAELHSFIGHPSERMAPALLAKHGIFATPEDFLAVRNVTHGIYGSPELEPTPGLANLWRALLELGVRIAVVSNTRVADLVLALERFKVLGMVDVIVGREYVTRTKPDPDPYLRALGFLAPDAQVTAFPEPPGQTGSLSPAARRAIAIEDSPAGIASAHAAGIYVVGFAGSDVRQDTSAADEVSHSFDELRASL